MMDVRQIQDSFGERIGPRLMQQFREAGRFVQSIKGDCIQMDDLEVGLFSLRTMQDLDACTGSLLDNLGLLFLEQRLGRDDDTYRGAIKIKASIRSFSTPEDIISVLKALFGASWVTYIPEYPAGCAVLSDGAVTQDQLERISPAGVQVRAASFLVDFDGNNIVDYNENLIYGVS